MVSFTEWRAWVEGKEHTTITLDIKIALKLKGKIDFKKYTQIRYNFTEFVTCINKDYMISCINK